MVAAARKPDRQIRIGIGIGAGQRKDAGLEVACLLDAFQQAAELELDDIDAMPTCFRSSWIRLAICMRSALLLLTRMENSTGWPAGVRAARRRGST